MPPVRNLPPGYEVVFPNRGKAGSRIVQLIVTALLLLSTALILAVTIGGWTKLQGLKPVNVVWCIVYVLMAIWIMRWNRGLLPIAATLALLMLMISVIAATGFAGENWFTRDHVGYVEAQSLLGGSGFGPNTIGLLVAVLAPVQLLLIIFCMVGFAQGWNVEIEAPIESGRRGQRGHGTPAAAATA